MLLWMEPFMWAYCRFIGNACTAIGLGGLLVFAGIAFDGLINKLVYEEGYCEDQN